MGGSYVVYLCWETLVAVAVTAGTDRGCRAWGKEWMLRLAKACWRTCACLCRCSTAPVWLTVLGRVLCLCCTCVLCVCRACAVPVQVFDAAPDGTRKVIVATNIAEASVTIDGVRQLRHHF